MNHIKGALHNLSTSEFPKITYGRGILVGVVSAIMQERGVSFQQAVAIVKPLLPADVRPQCIPDAWVDVFGVTFD